VKLEGESFSTRLSISSPLVRRRDDNTPKEEPLKYALLIYGNDTAWDTLSEDEQKGISGEYHAIAQVPGILGGEQLGPADTATTVRVENGSTLTTDGPFAETKEVLGGFYLFEAGDLDAAIELASRVPAARRGGAVEVRPLVEM
jgi:hypothetical protein